MAVLIAFTLYALVGAFFAGALVGMALADEKRDDDPLRLVALGVFGLGCWPVSFVGAFVTMRDRRRRKSEAGMP